MSMHSCVAVGSLGLAAAGHLGSCIMRIQRRHCGRGSAGERHQDRDTDQACHRRDRKTAPSITFTAPTSRIRASRSSTCCPRGSSRRMARPGRTSQPLSSSPPARKRTTTSVSPASRRHRTRSCPRRRWAARPTSRAQPRHRSAACRSSSWRRSSRPWKPRISFF